MDSKTKLKISKTLKGRIFTETHKQKISLTQQGSKNSFFGKKHSKKSKTRMSKAAKGKKKSIKMRNKLSKIKREQFKDPTNHPCWNRKQSKEEKAKRSKTLTGKKFSEEHKKKISKAAKGRKLSEEHKKKISSALKGKWLGTDSSQWKGGISCEPYCDVWLDKNFKEDIKKRDNYECQNPDCWRTCSHLSLHIHHINYNKKDCRPLNLITLCKSCNTRANFNRNQWEFFYSNLLLKKLSQQQEVTYNRRR